MRRNEFSFRNLTDLFESTPVSRLPQDRPIVIFSDLHLGNGKRTDDFLANSSLFLHVLNEYYYERDYMLILNGDIEELQRFRLADILQRWRQIYELFGAFEEDDRLYRLVGNHDMDLMNRADHPFAIREALRFTYRGNPIFIFHGHQTSKRFEKFNKLVGFGLRFFANPLKIKNYSVAHDSVKRFKTEERVYEFASTKKVLSIIGHTHRPLFESMSKVDSIKFEIERLCRKYPGASEKKQRRIERSIEAYRSELEAIDLVEDPTASIASLYNANLVVPCMFNSGTVVGKRGITCLEIRDDSIALVHWFDDRRSRKYLRYSNYDTEQLPGTDYHRVEIKSESLDYVFARINLLAGNTTPPRGRGAYSSTM
ncbi:MAG: metallophosphoesterase [Spirochaetota bacterium]